MRSPTGVVTNRRVNARTSAERLLLSRISTTQLCHRVHFCRTVDRGTLRCRQVDELPVLHPAAVCADQLHPRPRSRTPRWCSRCRSAKDEPPPRSGFVAGLIGRLQQRQLDHLTKRQREGARTSRPSAPATSRCSSGVQPADPGERDVSGVPDYNAVVELLPAP